MLVEPGVPVATRQALTAAHRKVVDLPGIGAVAAAGTNAGRAIAAGDPRKDGGAAVLP